MSKFAKKFPDVDLAKVAVLGKHPLFPHLAVVETGEGEAKKRLHAPLAEVEAATGKTVTSFAAVEVKGRDAKGNKVTLTGDALKAVIDARAKRRAEKAAAKSKAVAKKA